MSNRPQPPAGAEMSSEFQGPYLTLAEASDLARVSRKRIQNLMADGTLREGVHFSRPRGLRPRFRREALIAWLEGGDAGEPRMVERRRGRRSKVDLSLVSRIGSSLDGLQAHRK